MARARRYAAAIVARSPAVIPASSAARLLAAARSGSVEVLGAMEGAPLLAVDLASTDAGLGQLPPPAWLPCVVVGVAPRLTGSVPAGVDVAVAGSDGPGDGRGAEAASAGWVVVDDPSAELERLSGAVEHAPQPAVALAQVLRVGEHLDIEGALVVESLAYSTLQAGPAFASWLASRLARRSRPPTAPPASAPSPAVLVERDGDTLRLTLNRPDVRNAVSRRLRDELCEALAVACAEPSVRAVELRGAGPAFCSGGDLDEFGTLPDPLSAHLARTSRSPARLLATLAGRVDAHVHGACVGAGIELAAFAGRVQATPDATFSLPELGLGLIPGAGGTVSIPRRVGRHRTAWLALRGVAIDADRALDWGLVDEVVAATGPS